MAGKLADFALLADDPYALGADRLKEVRVAGVVFEGQPHMLARPMASVWAETDLPESIAARSRAHAETAACDCDPASDPCGHLVRLGMWLRDPVNRPPGGANGWLALEA